MYKLTIIPLVLFLYQAVDMVLRIPEGNSGMFIMFVYVISACVLFVLISLSLLREHKQKFKVTFILSSIVIAPCLLLPLVWLALATRLIDGAGPGTMFVILYSPVAMLIFLITIWNFYKKTKDKKILALFFSGIPIIGYPFIIMIHLFIFGLY
ncbi:hypothetical protein KAU86_00270 [bacterium]|nr:hypothetical protein [bacterium]